MSIGKQKDSKYYKSSGKRRNAETLTGLFLSLLFIALCYILKTNSCKSIFIFISALLLLVSLFILLHGLFLVSGEVRKKSVINRLIDDDTYVLADFDHGGTEKHKHLFSVSETYRYYFKYCHSNGKTYMFSSEEYLHARHFGTQAKVYVDWTRPGKMYWVSDYKIK